MSNSRYEAGDRQGRGSAVITVKINSRMAAQNAPTNLINTQDQGGGDKTKSKIEASADGQMVE